MRLVARRIDRLHAALLALLFGGCAAAPVQRPLDQVQPDELPVLFAASLVSTPNAIELNAALSPDGRELFFTRIVDGEYLMHRARLVDGAWTPPEPVRAFAGSERALAVDMSYSPDGRRLYFCGAPRSEPFPADPPMDLWAIERSGDGWSSATLLPAPLSLETDDEIYPCAVADGSLYFTSARAGGFGRSDVWRAQRLADGSFAAPENLGSAINTEHSEGDTWVSPDERMLVVSSSRPGGYGQGDLYVSFRAEDGTWSAPANLGAALNTAESEYCPMGTWDGRWFFFSRRDAPWETAKTGDVFWVDAVVLERGATRAP